MPFASGRGPDPVERAEGVFNALTDPWVPVEYRAGSLGFLSLADTLSQSATLRGLGPGMNPLERDTVTRLLISLAGLATRLDGLGPDADPDEIPCSGVAALRDNFEHHFWLRHPWAPFCQEWDLEQDDANKAIRELAYLDLQNPGASSSQWGISGAVADKSQAIAHNLARLTLLVAMTRWHTKHSNARDGHGRKFEYGAPGDVAVRTLGAYASHDESFALTLLANVPRQWLDSDSLPAYLAPDDAPADDYLARNPLDLWRTTYARNLPLLYWARDEAGAWAPTGYVLGPSKRRVPVVAPTESESLKGMHAHDPSRLFAVTTKKDGSEVATPVSALDVRLSSTEGYLRWYQNHLSDSLARWRARIDPVVEMDATDSWSIAVFAEICDVMGSRKWVDYVFVPRRRLTAPISMADGRPGPRILLSVAAALRSNLNGPLRMAAEGRTRAHGAPALRAQTERALLAALEDPIVRGLDAGSRGDADFAARTVADEMTATAIDVFFTATQPFATPSDLGRVAAARNLYRHHTRVAVGDLFDPEAAAERKRKDTAKKAGADPKDPS